LHKRLLYVPGHTFNHVGKGSLIAVQGMLPPAQDNGK
jgi:hypothetical protein